MGVVDRAEKVQRRIDDRINNIGSGKYGRVLSMAKNPDEEEFALVSKIAAAGVVLIGSLGFIIYLLLYELPLFLGW